MFRINKKSLKFKNMTIDYTDNMDQGQKLVILS